MENLIQKMKETLASTFSLYLKAHYFHWNVEGINFSQFHSFFGDLYEEYFSAIDPIAEELRTLNSYAPGSFIRFKELSVVQDEINIPSALTMVSKLKEDNMKLIVLLKETQKLAEENEATGLANFLQDRIDKHFKHDWMLRSILKG